MNDDILILYFYNDGLSDAERRRVAAQLAADSELRQRYDTLCRDLRGIVDTDKIAAPPDLAARWHDSIDRAAALERQQSTTARGVLHLPSFFWGTAITAVLVAGIAIGLFFGDRPTTTQDFDPSSMVVDVTRDDGFASAFTRGLQVHFRESRQSISSLADSADTDRQALIMHMVQQNRLFAREAKQNNTPELARVLRAFEPILLRLAADDITPQEATKLQAQLAFELNVMLTKLDSSPSKVANDRFESI